MNAILNRRCLTILPRFNRGNFIIEEWVSLPPKNKEGALANAFLVGFSYLQERQEPRGQQERQVQPVRQVHQGRPERQERQGPRGHRERQGCQGRQERQPWHLRQFLQLLV